MHHEQIAFANRGGRLDSLVLPPAQQELMPGVPWGRFDELFTPAFWAERAWIWSERRVFEDYALGRTLREELAACLLGGYGMPAELALAAFRRLRDHGLLSGAPEQGEIRALLSQPFEMDGRTVRYRFARQKSAYLADAMSRLDSLVPLPPNDRAFRDALLSLPGVGLKTASWVTRNWRRSDDVAILDVHICRACERAGVFSANSRPERDYLSLEQSFLAFAAAIDVRASVLDNLIWQTMRRVSRSVTQ